MSRKKLFLRLLPLAAVLALALMACPGDPAGPAGGGGGLSSNPDAINVSAADFAAKISEIKNTPGEYIINLTENLPSCSYLELDNPAVKITLTSEGDAKTISGYLDGEARAFITLKGTTLALENIVLNSNPNNPKKTGTLIGIYSGTVEMKAGAVLDGAPGPESEAYNGVWMDGGSFAMSDGTIQNCAGVQMTNKAENASIAISGGTISDNNMRNISFDGLDNELAMTGGTLVQQTTGRENVLIEGSGNSFTMSGGEIIRTLTDLSSVLMRGSNISFSKNLGGIISSDSGRVVRVTSPSATLLARYAAIPSGESLSAKTNAAGDGIASQSGSWD